MEIKADEITTKKKIVEIGTKNVKKKESMKRIGMKPGASHPKKKLAMMIAGVIEIVIVATNKKIEEIITGMTDMTHVRTETDGTRAVKEKVIIDENERKLHMCILFFL